MKMRKRALLVMGMAARDRCGPRPGDQGTRAGGQAAGVAGMDRRRDVHRIRHAGHGRRRGANPMSMMGSMFGGGQAAKNTFGNTQTSSAGRWVDVTLYTSRNPSLAEALQAVPAGTQLAPTLKLVSPKIEKAAPAPHDESVVPHEYERPKGKMYLYWGCGETVRAGQPRVLDMATAKPEDFGKFFTSRRATQRGAHSAAGRPLWPNEPDSRMVPAERFARRRTRVQRAGRSGRLQVRHSRRAGPDAGDRAEAERRRRIDTARVGGAADGARVLHRGDGREGRHDRRVGRGDGVLDLERSARNSARA